jgi:hypothetical protein
MKRCDENLQHDRIGRVPLALATTRGSVRSEDQIAELVHSACQPGSTTVVAEGSMMRRGPAHNIAW